MIPVVESLLPRVPKFERVIYIDFEYHSTNKPKYHLVAVSIESRSSGGVFKDNKVLWLDNNRHRQEKLRQFIERVKTDTLFVAFNVDAEGRSFHSLGIDPTTCHWFDLQAEYRSLLNHCPKYRYGKHLVKGEEVTLYPPVGYNEPKIKGRRYDDDREASLVATIYKMLGHKEDLRYKNKMRDLILGGREEPYTPDEKQRIMDYCKGDTGQLHDLMHSLINAHLKLYGRSYKKKYFQQALYRGESVARAAKITSTGYPVSKNISNFNKNIPFILKECQEDINAQFPEMQIFKWNKRENRYSMNQKPIKEWVEKQEIPNWPRTDTGQISLAKEAFEKNFPYRHTYPRGNLGAQILRFLILQQNLGGFGRRFKGRKHFLDYYDPSTERAYPFLAAYKARTSRFQPPSSGFIFLKSAWMRGLVHPKPDRVICSIDFGSQEFLLSGILSGDKKMVRAYKTGDVYLGFAKDAKMVPKDATKKTHGDIRSACKSTVLGVSYGMGANSLARKLSEETGKKVQKSTAEKYIHKFYSSYHKFSDWKENLIKNYEFQDIKYVQLADGWTLWVDPNKRATSIGNFPMQGMGGVILRRAIKLCQEADLKVIFPLHDALYIECLYKEYKEKMALFYQLMRQAVVDCFPDNKEDAGAIMLDGCIWGDKLSDGHEVIDGISTKTLTHYVDERADKEYNQFKKYFERVYVSPKET